MLLAMLSTRMIRAAAGNFTALALRMRIARCARNRLRFSAALGLITLMTLGAATGRRGAWAQEPDSGAAPQPQAPITPAVNPVGGQSAPAEPLFPQSQGPAAGSSNQVSPRVGNPLGPSSGAGLGYGPIHPGDIVEVEIFEAPEYSMKMPVSPKGEIDIPYAGLFHIEGMTSTQAASAIAALFKDRQILRDPHVIVTAQQYGYSVTILGEVRNPGIYPLAGKQRLIDVLTEAGGVTDRAGHVIDIFPSGSMKNPDTVLWDPTLRENDNAEVPIKVGETVLVSRCGVVYVGGNVGRPGAFQICDSNHTTLTEVIAMALGVKASSWGQRTLLLRASSTGTRVTEVIKLEDVFRGKRMDPTMETDDIVYVPPSDLKAASKIVVTAAIGFATQAYFYLH